MPVPLPPVPLPPVPLPPARPRSRSPLRTGGLRAGGVRSLAALLLLALAACHSAPPPPGPAVTSGPAVTPPAAPPPTLSLSPARYADLPGWDRDRVAAALPALTRSCARLTAPGAAPLRVGGISVAATDWAAPCAALAAVRPGDDAALRRVLQNHFQPWAASDGAAGDGAGDGADNGLFTGYYEAELHGSRHRHGPYQTPVYRRPDDLVTLDLGDFPLPASLTHDAVKGVRLAGRVRQGKLVPYDDRRAIDAGALAGRGLELLWLDDPVAAFFLHIQGSGRVTLDDGTVARVGYDGQNGWPYVAIGRRMADEGKLPRDGISMQSIRAWLTAHPAETPGVLQGNPSYVFFRPLPGVGADDGPLGGEGVPLTPGRSLAVDHTLVPYGLPVWLDADDPLNTAARLDRLLVAQDTGGAIRGPVRGDVFWGHGAEAEQRAGLMKSRGRYWFLLPRAVVAGRGPGGAGARSDGRADARSDG